MPLRGHQTVLVKKSSVNHSKVDQMKTESLFCRLSGPDSLAHTGKEVGRRWQAAGWSHWSGRSMPGQAVIPLLKTTDSLSAPASLATRAWGPHEILCTATCVCESCHRVPHPEAKEAVKDGGLYQSNIRIHLMSSYRAFLSPCTAQLCRKDLRP